jgi:hypothetical protein
MNSPQFSKRPRFSFSVAVRSRRATASRFSHAFALDCRTSRCSRIRPAWPRLGFYRSCAVGEAFKGPDIGDVCYPDAVWRFHVELTVQRVVDNHGRLAAIASRPGPVADLGLDAGNPGKTGNPVRAARLALIQQVIM